MKQISKIVQIAAFMMLIFLGCTKDDIIPYEVNSVEGVYIGNTYELHRWSNLVDGYNEEDTIYIDTFFVSIVSNDTIVFMNKGREWIFKLDTTDYYIERYGSHSIDAFEINSYDSLKANYWSYHGDGETYYQIDIEFNGIKQ